MDTLKFDLISPTASIWRAKRKGRTRGPRVFRFSMLPSLSVAASMPAGVETRIIDENVEPVDFDTDADLIGITFMTFNAPRAYEIAARFRDRGKTVIFGGFHPTFLPYEAIAHCDAVCVGEAEYNVPRMIEDFRAGRLRPIYRSRRVDLADLPPMPGDLLQRKRYLTPNVLQATRGCPYRCKVCSIAAFHGYELSYLAPSSILRGSVPLNLGYRARFGRNGTLEKGARFEAAYGAGARPEHLHTT